jgi:uncharacterized Zn finger protein
MSKLIKSHCPNCGPFSKWKIDRPNGKNKVIIKCTCGRVKSVARKEV